VGDPVILTLRVEGRGNVKLLPRPALDIPWASAVDGGERVELDSTALTVRGAKEFDWILTARAAGDRTVPAIRYSYFDPVARRYDAAASAPMPLQVLPGTLANGGSAHDQLARSAPLPIRLSFGGEVGVPLPTRPSFWLLVALVPLPAVLVGLVSRVPRRRATGMAPARALRVLAGARADAPPSEVRRAFVGAVRDRLALGREAFAAPDVLARRLRRRGVTAETARAAAAMLRTLDGAAFGATRADAALAEGSRRRARAGRLGRLRAPRRRGLRAAGLTARSAGRGHARGARAAAHGRECAGSGDRGRRHSGGAPAGRFRGRPRRRDGAAGPARGGRRLHGPGDRDGRQPPGRRPRVRPRSAGL
jgi:hypothetical protein